MGNDGRRMPAERRGAAGSSNGCRGRLGSAGRHIGAEGALSRGEGTADGTSGSGADAGAVEAATGGGVAIADQSRGGGVGPGVGPGVVGAAGRDAAGPFGTRAPPTIAPGARPPR